MTLSQKCCRGTVQTTTSHLCSHSNSYNWRHHVRSSLKDALNSSVFICRLNAMYDSHVLTDAGRAFEARAAATGNVRSPSVVHRVVGTSSVDVDCWQMFAAGTSQSVIGIVLCMALHLANSMKTAWRTGATRITYCLRMCGLNYGCIWLTLRINVSLCAWNARRPDEPYM